ncbi:MAG TPA: leucine-rich repeat domain-containing protein, partial [Xanthomonadales bacterium]|nr:leucine-rich repeat domain-containing protein [Xanthomonadales bacterium]
MPRKSTQVTEVPQQEISTKISRKTILLLAVLLLILLIPLVLLYLTQKNGDTSDSKNNSINSQSSTICDNNPREHLLEEAKKEPENVCIMRIPEESDLSDLAKLSNSLVNLKTIYFNKTASQIPSEIGDITTLTALNFHHTTGTVLPPEIGKLQNLEILHISKADIEKLPPEIGKLQKLKQLIIALNVKNVSLPKTLEELPSLNVLTLRANPGIALPEISRIKSIEYLDLTDNSLKELAAGVYQLQKLKILNLSYNKISLVKPEIGSLVNLQALRLDNNLLTSIPYLGNLKNLETLNLSNNSLTVIPEGVENL